MFEKILVFCEKFGFLKKQVLPLLKQDQLKVGPTGLLLQENLRTEWLKNIVINKDMKVFLSSGDISDSLNFAKVLCLESLPFGIAEILVGTKTSTKELIDDYNERLKNTDIDFRNFFDNEDRIILRCSLFVSSQNSTSLFHQWQMQRRMWWRKFSPSPGRYSLTDIRNGDNNTQHVEIHAKYPWGSQLLESLSVYPVNKNLSSNSLQFKEGRKFVQAHSVVSETDLSVLFLNSICDAYDEPVVDGKSRTLLRFHRKLAPYKISFALTATSTSIMTELQDLALYLCRQLRTNHISTLYLLSSAKFTLEAQWVQYDQLGIPYNVQLNENTLKNGIVLLRSRDTTLKEQVHVTDLIAYVEKLFKNY